MGLGPLFTTLIYLLIAGLFLYVLFWGLGKLALPEPVAA